MKWLALCLILAVVLLTAFYQLDIRQAYERVGAGSSLLESPHGAIEYLDGGAGPAVLVIHGSGGGFDQGELLAQVLLPNGFHWIAPSRFGYLRSTFEAGATFDDQAHAYAYLLDRLGYERVAVVCLSHGCPSALLFAVWYPERVSTLALVSGGVAATGAPEQAQASRKGDLLTTVFRYDFLYWIASKLFRKQLVELMGADDAVIDGLTAGQRTWVDRLIDGMNPVSPRSAGVVFDNRAAMPNERIAAIRAPTLIIHAADDSLQIVENAEYAAALIPGARLIRYEQGGHLLAIVEQPSIAKALREHLSDTLEMASF